ncbi:glycoside hydrolase family 113 [Ascidiimonas aurantiaca]|uniref:glycoside hydrolase family 113 n=1 Tax=Ascidiimonas aurantiaca TaxID=1685432 RepID=UPI0030EBFFD3
MRKAILFFTTTLLLSGMSCSPKDVTKINGISFVGSRDKIEADAITPVTEVNANWSAVMPFAFSRSTTESNLMYNDKRQWWGEREEGAEETCRLLKQQGLKVMLKPQIWIWGGVFTGTIRMSNEKQWQAFEASYEAYILANAKLAQKVNAELFCIGTEMYGFVEARPQFWERLIQKVRSVYDGKLTYAENWDSFHKVPFWEQLDYIGIDAYFPLSETKTPQVEELRKAWQKHKEQIRKVQQTTGIPVLFTEYGYRSIDFTAKEPWKFDSDSGQINTSAQNNALMALYEEFWPEKWFAGGFLWKWFDYHHRAGGITNKQFTPQNKPAEIIVRDFYGRWP